MTEEATRVVHRAAYDPRGDGRRGRNPRHAASSGRRCGPGNVKRAPGAALDIEFLVQMYQLRYAGDDPSLRVPNTAAALIALHQAGRINSQDYEILNADYRYLRTLKSRLRLLSLTARNDLPTDELELEKLARSLSYATAKNYERLPRVHAPQPRAVPTTLRRRVCGRSGGVRAFHRGGRRGRGDREGSDTDKHGCHG